MPKDRLGKEIVKGCMVDIEIRNRLTGTVEEVIEGGLVDSQGRQQRATVLIVIPIPVSGPPGEPFDNLYVVKDPPTEEEQEAYRAQRQAAAEAPPATTKLQIVSKKKGNKY